MDSGYILLKHLALTLGIQTLSQQPKSTVYLIVEVIATTLADHG